ncbi:hypothetical protein K470DRAFT_22390 [Piedraia hortae CBS 480.64]|uniref:Uncharacterized protein n=1 Tax=Piedraia hortae CBS 480.64 TaxID=1314780 RepID=A0A6A7C4U8_9PEZI|nr:hypothetical protein K470DRAFT_22390 [Piedraia hortae CBS 480.64]
MLMAFNSEGQKGPGIYPVAADTGVSVFATVSPLEDCRLSHHFVTGWPFRPMVVSWMWFTRCARTRYARASCAEAHEYIVGPLALCGFHTGQYLARTWALARPQ